MITVMKFVFGLLVACGFIVVLGTAGADCDGKCMENALTIGEIMQYTFYGIVMIAVGAFGLIKMSEV
jgi:hypothetical protein